MEIATEVVAVTTTGDAGSATGIARTEAMHGFLLDVFLDFHASAPATTDTTIAFENPNNGAFIVVTSSVTDGLFAPRQGLVTPANAAIGYATGLFPVNGVLTVSLAQSDALDPALTARIRYLRL